MREQQSNQTIYTIKEENGNIVQGLGGGIFTLSEGKDGVHTLQQGGDGGGQGQGGHHIQLNGGDLESFSEEEKRQAERIEATNKQVDR